LGGWNRYAKLVLTREEFGGVTRWQIIQLEKLGVVLRLGEEATVDKVLQEKPDAVVVSTGSTLNVPLVDNIYNSDGTLPKNVVFVSDVLMNKAPVGEKIVVIGANDIGLEVSEFLAEKGKRLLLLILRKRLRKRFSVE